MTAPIKATLSDLAERAEAATADEQVTLIAEAGKVVFGPDSPAFLRLAVLLSVGAFLDAAASLVPEGGCPHDLLVEAAGIAWNRNCAFGRDTAETSALFLKALPRFVTAAALRSLAALEADHG